MTSCVDDGNRPGGHLICRVRPSCRCRGQIEALDEDAATLQRRRGRGMEWRKWKGGQDEADGIGKMEVQVLVGSSKRQANDVEERGRRDVDPRASQVVLGIGV